MVPHPDRRGKGNPSFSTILGLAEALGVEPAVLLASRPGTVATHEQAPARATTPMRVASMELGPHQAGRQVTVARRHPEVVDTASDDELGWAIELVSSSGLQRQWVHVALDAPGDDPGELVTHETDEFAGGA